ncbi:hypothetical protein WT67_30950 [Burkholderia stagnalis]|uniref:Uncharacterized protein n=1 Tax=Burkholderia stagnalis TaxID=1503054 RepID=A0A104VFB7_9BURK|nr:hypothetical protein [Burkholderia stagnalis]KAB0631562.1 hypothetical protein F7R25_35655 [Burkholderia stagnalis]KVN27564.1 hypothetical protein WT11_27325 [Burkholderia stagnalis]KVO40375.1 hypothetical protein WT17_18150 [Burkholderia stagnalis]KVO71130.1 hypothetical protein WT19_18510 [Burkholderia stagnalis]KVW69097.1 hypothetical protein WT28_02235 [Burkholderia stagnalis]
MSHATYRSDSGYRAIYQTGAPAAVAPAAEPRAALDTQALLALAREAGMLVMLDAQIGSERYESVTGSVAAFARFAQALRLSTLEAA